FRQHLAIGLHALKEAVELGGLRILRVSPRVNLRRPRIRLPADLLDLAVSRRLDLIQVALLLSGNAGGFAFTFRTEPLRDLPALLVCSHDLDQVVLGDGIARLAAENVLEARLGASLIVQPDEIDLGIIDAPAREGIDVDVSLVSGRNSHGQSVPFQEALIDA